MYYCCSDLHGCYDQYRALLKKINLKDQDTLYILGDVVDRGPESIRILQDMMLRINVIPILGDHEYMALQVLRGLLKEVTEDNLPGFDDTVAMMHQWMENGGGTTLEEFQALDEEQREAVLEYLLEFALYEEVSAGGRDFVLVHGGLMNFSPARDLEDYTPEELIFERADYGKPYFKNKILVTGHTPTRLIPGNPNPDRIYCKNGHIALDCGCVFGGKLAAICLDTGREFYVDNPTS